MVTRSLLFCAPALLLSGVAACARDGSEAAPDSAAPGTASMAVVAPKDTILVEIHEWRISMSRDSIAPGPVVFRVFNKAAVPHELEVENQDEEFEAGEIAPGSYIDLTADVDRGKYEVYCPLAGPTGSHANRGMKTVLTVF